MMSTEKCVSAIRCNDLIIYVPNLDEHKLEQFIESKDDYLLSEDGIADIILDGTSITLYEWKKYRVISPSNSFIPKDFLDCGEYISSSIGTLRFENCMGTAKFKGVLLQVISKKLNELEYNCLLDTVNSFIANLSFDFNRSTNMQVIRNRNQKTDVDYHIFLLIYQAMRTEKRANNLFSNLSIITSMPFRSLEGITDYVGIEDASEISDSAIVDVLSGNSVLVPTRKNCKLSQKFSKNGINMLPKDVLIEDITETLDNPENRFVKYFIVWIKDILCKYMDIFEHKDDFRNYEMLAFVEACIKKLKMILQQTFFVNVGEINYIPLNSTVLNGRDGYRQLFQLFISIKSLPEISDEKVEEMIENKSLDVLYENYCYFQFSSIISSIYGEKLNKKKLHVEKTIFSKTLEKKSYSNYYEFSRNASYPQLRVHYNIDYVKECYSKHFDPDISLEIYDKNDELKYIYVFDAKFRSINLKGGEPEDKTFNNDDITKMHAYKDAIILAKGAYVLYPGSEKEIYLEDKTKADQLVGVGAFPFRPGHDEDTSDLLNCLADLLSKVNC